MEWQNKELPGIAEKVPQSIRREEEEKGPSKEWKSTTIASCSGLEGKFSECSKRERVGCGQRQSISEQRRPEGRSAT